MWVCVSVCIGQSMAVNKLSINLEKQKRKHVERLYCNRSRYKSNAFCGVEVIMHGCVYMTLFIVYVRWLVSGSSILSHSHPLLPFYGFVHDLNRCGLSIVIRCATCIHELCCVSIV